MNIDSTTWNSVPHLFTGEDYREMAHWAIEAWRLRLTPEQLQRVKDKCAYTRQNLKNSTGLSDSGELQFAFMLPETVDCLIATVTKDSNWPRTRPALLEALVDEFRIGVMGEYSASVKGAGSNARRDFGCALGEGDRD